MMAHWASENMWPELAQQPQKGCRASVNVEACITTNNYL